MDSVSKAFWFVVIIIVFIISKLPVRWWSKLLVLFLVWAFVVYFVSRLFIPSLGFRKLPIPSVLPSSLRSACSSLQGLSQEETLQKAYDLITQRFFMTPGKTFFSLRSQFWTDASEWDRTGYASCSKMNYFLRVLLVCSGAFCDDDISLRHRPYRYNIHQYVRVQTSKGVVVLDPAFAYASIPFARKNDRWWKKGFRPERYDGLYYIK